MASWLDSAFMGIDKVILSFFHLLANAAGGIFTPFFRFLSAFGYGGFGFLAIALVLMLFPKTRKAGFVIAITVAFAALAGELLKMGFDRTRPFNATDQFHDWWVFVQGVELKSSSFPSGHVTACTAFCVALFMEIRKPWTVDVGIVLVLLMCFARNYFMMHYPSDCVAGIIVGFLLALAVVKLVNACINKYNERKAAKDAVAGA